MATAEELLSGASGVDKTLVIDNDFRKIIIPSSVPTLGVETDDEVLRLDFKMPRYVSNTDLSTYPIRVNYINANGESDAYTVKDAVVGVQYITFTWLVGPIATQYKGDTRFSVSLTKLTSDGLYVDKKFNTTPATLPVLEGLEVDEGIVTQYSDIIEQWRQELFGIGDTEEASIKAVSAAEQEAITNKGAEVLATIPADYTTAVSMTDNADRTKADAIICSSQGETISVSDSSDDYLRGLKIFGKTTQVSTTGAQLADFTSGNTASGVTKTFLNDTLTITGDGSLTYQSWSVEIYDAFVAHPGEDLYFDYESLTMTGTADGTVIQLNISKTDDTNQYIALYNKSGSRGGYTIPDDVSDIDSVSLAVYTTNSATAMANKITIVKPMLQIGTESIEYEPYSGRYSSPSPNWGQPLNGVENPTVSICGRNLIPSLAADVNNQGVTYTLNEDGSITLNGTATAYSCCCGVTIEALSLRGKTLILRGASEEGTKDVVTQIKFMWDGGYLFRSVNGKASGVFEVPMEAETMRFEAYVGTGVTVSDFTVYPQLVLGTSLPDYEPYIERQSMAHEYVLNGLTVSSSGNCTDQNSQQWIGDEIDLENGVRRQRVVIYEFDGSTDESWILGYSSNGVSNRFQIMTTALPIAHEVLSTNISAVVALNAACTHFEYEYTSMIPSTNKFRVSHSVSAEKNYWYLLFNPDTSVVALEDLDAWRDFLSENPITVMLPLSTPIETALTADEIAAFQFAHTNYPNTTVLNDSGATMELKYNADTATFLRNCAKPTDEQVQAAVNDHLDTNPIELPVDKALLTDTVTGKQYRLYVENGKLKMEVI